MSTLIPHAKSWMAAEKNVLLYGKHGTGKTESILTTAAGLGLKVAYFSCSTLDPWTDLTGIPVPREIDGFEHIKMLRPVAIDEAELIVLDELNRSDVKTRNALMQIIQFRKINDDELRNLKMIWAAINPPDDIYDVEDLDPALVDRFDFYHEVSPQVSRAYMSQHMPKPIAKALATWWEGHNDRRDEEAGYVSPRKVDALGRMWMEFRDSHMVAYSGLPPAGSFDRQKLVQLLDEAAKEIEPGEARPAAKASKVGDAPVALDLDLGALKANVEQYAKVLADSPQALETHRAVADALLRVPAAQIVTELHPLADALQGSLLEGVVFAGAQRRKRALDALDEHNIQAPNLRAALGG